MFTYLYDISDFDNPNIAERREHGGFLIQNEQGSYGFTEFPDSWPRYACGIGAPPSWYESAPSNTVGMIHSHPFFEGEDTSASNVCGNVPGADNYQSKHSNADWLSLIDLSSHLGNPQVKGFIIDGNNVITYNVTTPTNPEAINSRCGY